MLPYSFWEETMPPLQTDIAIIGCGFLGLWSALLAKEKFPKASVVIVDEFAFQSRASTRNAGFACFGSPSEIWADVQLSGEQTAFDCVEKRWKGLQLIQQYCNKEALQWENFGGYECFETNFSQEVIQYLNKPLKAITGANQCFTPNHESMRGFGLNGFAQLYKNALESQLHSGAYWQFLLELCQAKDVKMVGGIKVTNLLNNANTWALYEQNRMFLQASTVLVATNASINALLPQAETITPQRGTILVTEPLPQLALKGCFHVQEGYYYFRNVGDRILLGGARNTSFSTENTRDTSVEPSIENALNLFLRKHILAAASAGITHCWSGTMGFTNKKQPVVAELEKGVFYACGCNGMGVALTPVLAQEWVSKL